MPHKKPNLYIKIILVALIATLVVLCIFLAQQYRAISQQKIIPIRHFNLANLPQRHTLGINEINLIEPWMTFNYVSISFKVPTSYFLTALEIPSSTKNYPNITINHYAKIISVNPDSFTEKVKTAVQQYLAPK